MEKSLQFQHRHSRPDTNMRRGNPAVKPANSPVSDLLTDHTTAAPSGFARYSQANRRGCAGSPRVASRAARASGSMRSGSSSMTSYAISGGPLPADRVEDPGQPHGQGSSVVVSDVAALVAVAGRRSAQ